MQQDLSNASWRDTGRPTKLGFLNSRVVFPVLLMFLHIRLWTFILMVLAVTAFVTLDYYGYKPIVFARCIRSYLAGPRRCVRLWWA
ncbi:MAG: IcmT/TraK family protein [Pseudomonadota bacterium]|nr:IcmT/TraK family protein [Pseudomonadota bacterium]